MQIILITPVKTEYHAAREVFSAKEVTLDENFEFRAAEAKLGKKKIRILQTGMGTEKIPLVKKFIKIHKPDLIIDSGSCGSLHDDFFSGYLVFSDKIINSEDSGCICMEAEFHKALSVMTNSHTMVQVASPLADDTLRINIKKQFQADFCSMESYSIIKIAEDMKIGWLCLRVVTDNADSFALGDFKKNIRKNSLYLYSEIKKLLIKKYEK